MSAPEDDPSTVRIGLWRADAVVPFDAAQEAVARDMGRWARGRPCHPMS
ncbi:hypothetical protein [Streptomyces sp. NPDC002889]